MSWSFGIIDHDGPLAAAADRKNWSRGFGRDEEGNISSHAHIRELTLPETIAAAATPLLAAGAVYGGALLVGQVRQHLRARAARKQVEVEVDSAPVVDPIPFRPRAQSPDAA